MSFELLDQGNDWIAINKPAGIGMHSEQQAGLVVQASQVFERPLWPVHRLDKLTSGILLFATTSSGAARLSALFAEQTIEKYYLAQSIHRPKKKQGWIKGDMSKGRNGSWLLHRSLIQPAVTQFVSQHSPDLNRRLFLLRPYTGKTHQLRVALKSLGSPILGDPRYGSDAANRGYLHAYGLRWQEHGHWKEIICPPPQNSEETWPIPLHWQQPWQLFH